MKNLKTRQLEAEQRKEKRAARLDTDQLAIIATRRGESKREVARLSKNK
ncbi:MAG TPA: hypothetical protein VLH56_19445 [Dissulfurispiraceae bacterium]|nr:hypothetical protein [Dissulfurispiraceae bacterium]